MDTQTKYALDQYNLCCRHLKISPRYDDEGRTLFEAIVMMENDIKQLDDEWWHHRLYGVEELAKMEAENLKLQESLDKMTKMAIKNMF